MNRLFKITDSRNPSFNRYAVVTNGDMAARASYAVLSDYIRTNLPGSEADYTVTEVDTDVVIVLDARDSR